MAFPPRPLHVAITLCLFLPLVANAQIINVESKRGDLKKEGWKGSIDFNLDYTRNVSEILQYGNKTTVQYLKDRHLLLILADLYRVQAGGTDFVNNGYEHVRYSYALNDKRRLAWEVFEQMQFNSVQKITFRALLGTGPRWNVFRGDSLEMSLGSLPMYEFEELTDGTIERNFRLSSYLQFAWILNKSFQYSNITYFQPAIGRWNDYRLSHESTIELRITRTLRYKITANLLYDTNVPIEVPDFIFTLTNGLSIEF